MTHKFMREHAAYVGEDKIQHGMLDDTPMPHFHDVAEVPVVSLADALHVRIQPRGKGSVAEPSHYLAEPLRIARGIGGPVRRAYVLEIVL